GSGGITTYVWDYENHPTKVMLPTGTRNTFSYDALGQRRLLIEPEGGRFTYAYDDAGRTRLLVNPQDQRTTWTYDAAGRVTVQRLANTTRTSYTYDDANQVTRLLNTTSGGTTISSFDYAYDSVGNRTRVVEAGAIRVTWSYDNLYQLTRERRSGANSYDITYTYDAAGNRRTKLDNAITTTYSYDAANELRTLKDNTGTTTYAYDANGNQRTVQVGSGGITTYVWDYENHPTKVMLPTGTRNTFSYDADGKRVKKDDSAGTSKFLWDLENILLETDSSDLTQAIYTLEPHLYGNLISQYRSATSSFFHFEALGSTDRLTNGTGSVTDSYGYKAFGNINVSSGVTINPFKYVGEQGYVLDADLAQYHLRARYYRHDVARFLSHDPLAYQIFTEVTRNRFLCETELYFRAFLGTPVAKRISGAFCAIPPKTSFTKLEANLYTYVNNNPLRLADPSGLQVTVSDCRKAFNACWTAATLAFLACTAPPHGELPPVFVACTVAYLAWARSCRIDLALCLKTAIPDPPGPRTAYPPPYPKPLLCFTGRTCVLTSNGPVPIELIRTGDLVLTYDFIVEQVVKTRVLTVDVHEGDFEIMSRPLWASLIASLYTVSRQRSSFESERLHERDSSQWFHSSRCERHS
ncbi:MAG: hypothetical protein HY000_01625, partial [Planctomycetes bacterium]|nr:hypothetical protein [Planctomycetota bacterium]